MNYDIEMELGSGAKGPLATGTLWIIGEDQDDSIGISFNVWERDGEPKVSWPFRSYVNRQGETNYDNQVTFGSEEFKNALNNEILDKFETLEIDDKPKHHKSAAVTTKKTFQKKSREVEEDDDDDKQDRKPAPRQFAAKNKSAKRTSFKH